MKVTLANLPIQVAELAPDIFAPNKPFTGCKKVYFGFRLCMYVRVLLNQTTEAIQILWLHSIFPSFDSQPLSRCISDSLECWHDTRLLLQQGEGKTKLEGFLSLYRRITGIQQHLKSDLIQLSLKVGLRLQYTAVSQFCYK